MTNGNGWMNQSNVGLGSLLILGCVSLLLAFFEGLHDFYRQIAGVLGVFFLYSFMMLWIVLRDKATFLPPTLHHQLGFGSNSGERSILQWSIFLWIPLLLQVGGYGVGVVLSDPTIYAAIFLILALHLAGSATSDGLEFLLNEEPDQGINWIDIFADQSKWISERKELGAKPGKRGILCRLILICLGFIIAVLVNLSQGLGTIYGLPANPTVLAATLLAYWFWTVAFVSLVSIIATNTSMFRALTTTLEDIEKLKIFRFLGRFEKWISDGCPPQESDEVLERLTIGANHYGLFVRAGFITRRFWTLVAIVLLSIALPLAFASYASQPISLAIGFIGFLGPYLVAASFIGVEFQVHKVLSNSRRAILDAYSLLLERETTNYLAYKKGVKERLEHIQDMFEYAEGLPEWTFNIGTFFAWGFSVLMSLGIQIIGIVLNPVG